MKKINIFIQFYFLIITIIFCIFICNRFVFIKNNKILHSNTINLVSSFITGEIDENQIIENLKTILLNNEINREEIAKYIEDYINNYSKDNNNILKITKETGNIYKVKINKHDNIIFTDIIDFDEINKCNRPQIHSIGFDNQGNSNRNIEEIIEDRDIIIVTEDNYKKIEKQGGFKIEEEEYTIVSLDVVDRFDEDNTTPVTYKLAYKMLTFKNSNKKIFIFILPEFSYQYYIIKAQILYDFLELVCELQCPRIKLFCVDYINTLLMQGYNYRNKIKQNPNEKINLIKDPGLNYYVSK
jgi:hypothetical protein